MINRPFFLPLYLSASQLQDSPRDHDQIEDSNGHLRSPSGKPRQLDSLKPVIQRLSNVIQRHPRSSKVILDVIHQQQEAQFFPAGQSLD